MKSKCNYDYTVYKVIFALCDFYTNKLFCPVPLYFCSGIIKRTNCPVLKLLTGNGDELTKYKMKTNISPYILQLMFGIFFLPALYRTHQRSAPPTPS